MIVESNNFQKSLTEELRELKIRQDHKAGDLSVKRKQPAFVTSVVSCANGKAVDHGAGALAAR